MRTDITWENGGAAELLSLSGDWFVVLSNTPQAPGKPWRGTVASGAFVGLKVKTCKKQPSGLFVIEGPAFNLTKEGREELLALGHVPTGAPESANDQPTPAGVPAERSAPEA
jgi:hypothetical protein